MLSNTSRTFIHSVVQFFISN